MDADLRNADLRNADLTEADLTEANLRNADLRRADLRNADLDFSALPLWCGSLDMKIDERLFSQLLYHVMSVCPHDLKKTFKKAALKQANDFHRVESGECTPLTIEEKLLADTE